MLDAMQFDLDLQFRLAVFEHVHRLRAANGGVVTSQQLNAGITFNGRRVPIWNPVIVRGITVVIRSVEGCLYASAPHLARAAMREGDLN